MQLQFTLAIYCKVRHMLQNLQTPQSITPLRLSMTMDKASAICSTSCQMLLGAAEISIIRAHTASYAITFLPGGSFCIVPSMMIYRAFVSILWSGNTHYKFGLFLADNQPFASRRLRRLTQNLRVASPSLPSGRYTRVYDACSA